MGNHSPTTTTRLCPPLASRIPILVSGRVWEWEGEREQQEQVCEVYPRYFSNPLLPAPASSPLLRLQISALVLSFSPLPAVGLPPLTPGTAESHSSVSSGCPVPPAHRLGFLVLTTCGNGVFSIAWVQCAPCPGLQASRGRISFFIETAS